jgi:hypothetical protein
MRNMSSNFSNKKLRQLVNKAKGRCLRRTPTTNTYTSVAFQLFSLSSPLVYNLIDLTHPATICEKKILNREGILTIIHFLFYKNWSLRNFLSSGEKVSYKLL